MIDPVFVRDMALVAPGDFKFADFCAGRSAVIGLKDMPVAVGAPFLGELPEIAWQWGFVPRALRLAFEARKRLELDDKRTYGLILGLPNLFSETQYLEHVLPHRESVAEMKAVLGFGDQQALGFLADQLPACGPRIRLDSACATGNDCLILAHQWLCAGLVSDVVVICASAMLNPVGLALFHNLKALNDSNDLKASRPFDHLRRGFVMGEGAAAVWLTARPESPCLGTVLGYGQTMSASHFVDPPEDISTMVQAAKLALGDCQDLAFVSAHGTATKAGDQAEVALQHALFAERACHIPITATKSQIGHCLGAAALIEAIVCWQALSHGVVPGIINFERADDGNSLDYVTASRKIHGAAALSNAFAFGGHNSCVLLGRGGEV